MRIIGVIPARYKSTRFPGKPLADICGKPMVYWVYQNAAKVKELEDVFVATDDTRIENACRDLNLRVIMTSDKHLTGTDRIGEVAKNIKADIYINIQGDEPLVEPQTIRSCIQPFLENDSGNISVTNLMTAIRNPQDLMNPTVPKVAVNAKNQAIFLSRLPIPYYKSESAGIHYKQVCIYGFKLDALQQFCRLERGPAEKAEDIELLRFIENDLVVQMVEVKQDTVAVDTPADLERVREIFSKRKGL